MKAGYYSLIKFSHVVEDECTLYYTYSPNIDSYFDYYVMVDLGCDAKEVSIDVQIMNVTGSHEKLDNDYDNWDRISYGKSIRNGSNYKDVAYDYHVHAVYLAASKLYEKFLRSKDDPLYQTYRKRIDGDKTNEEAMYAYMQYAISLIIGDSWLVPHRVVQLRDKRNNKVLLNTGEADWLNVIDLRDSVSLDVWGRLQEAFKEDNE